jgi:murein DD-endopeptidase MepM/ murein hydrolase activator NlpD
MRYPFEGTFDKTQTFNQENAVLIGGRHKGVDFALPCGTPIFPILTGVVVKASFERTLGFFLSIQSGNITHEYFHLKELKVNVGQQVSEGQIIALSGTTGLSTGCHLHLQVFRDNVLINPIALLDSAQPVQNEVYTIVPGDTLSGIAERFNITLQALLAGNPQFQANPNLIFPGQHVILI